MQGRQEKSRADEENVEWSLSIRFFKENPPLSEMAFSNNRSRTFSMGEKEGS